MLKLLKDKALVARRFSIANWMTLMEAWWLLLFFNLTLRLKSYDHLSNSSFPQPEKLPDSSHTLTITQKLQPLVGYASRLHPIPMTCLVKSLALQKMLSKRSIPAQVKIGTQKIHNALYAHAWVEVNGVPIGEASDLTQKFHVLESIANLHHRNFV